jgi:hypothetical protein
MIRAFTPNDVTELERLYHLYFEETNDLPNFLNFICAFVVEDEQGVVSFGGVRAIPEIITVTNMTRTPSERIQALYNLLDASIFVSQRCGYQQLYAWSQGSKWTKRIMKNGFRPSDGQSLILDL